MKTPETSKLLHDITFKPKQRLRIFNQLDRPQQLSVLQAVSKKVATNIVTRIDVEEIARILNKADPDDATDILRLLDETKRDMVINHLSDELQSSAVRLLQFDPQTAAGLMSIDYIQVETSTTIQAVLEKFKIHEKRTGRIPTILTMKNGHLSGTLPIAELVLGKPTDSVSKYVKSISSLYHHANKKKVIEMFRAHPHDKIVVLNDDRSIVGIIYSDDVLSLLREFGSASLYRFAGIGDDESVLDSATHKVKSRGRWLVLNLMTAFIAAFAVSLFEDTIAQFVVLAIYMPIVAGMGGNAATQTLAVVVRGIALKQISLNSSTRALRNELAAGFINGIINGLIVAGIVLIINQDFRLAFVLALAMVLNLLVAGLFGTLIPLLVARLGKDPASSATVFITTATDVLGFIMFLGLGQLILR